MAPQVLRRPEAAHAEHTNHLPVRVVRVLAALTVGHLVIIRRRSVHIRLTFQVDFGHDRGKLMRVQALHVVHTLRALAIRRIAQVALVRQL